MPTRPRTFRAPHARTPAHKRGYDRRWHKARTAYLAEHPLCAECDKHGRVEAATCVDHIIPVRNGQNDPNFWRESNWAALCAACHNRKTRAENRVL